MQTLTARQKQVFDFIVGYIDTRGYPPTLQEIANDLGVSGNLGVLRHLKALESKGLIKRNSGSSRSIVVIDKVLRESNVLPVFSAESPDQTDLSMSRTEEFLAVDRSMIEGKDCFMLLVRTESMVDAHIMPGDFVIVKPQDAVENGDMVAASVNNEVTLRRYYREGEEVRLKAENQSMKSLIYRSSESSVWILGRVLGLWRSLK